jgi:hypothetical protein
MNQNDVLKIVSILEVSYPQHYTKLTQEQLQNQIMLWSELWKDTDANVIANAVKTIISTDTNPFPPTIGQINSKAYDLTHKPSLTEQEIVKCIKEATKHSLYYSKREYSNLPLEAQALCSPSQLQSWANIDEREVDTVIMSLVTRGYQKRVEVNKQNDMTPNSVKVAISGIVENMKIENKGE